MVDMKRVREIIAANRPALIALAHSDDGQQREGCHCPFCAAARKETRDHE